MVNLRPVAQQVVCITGASSGIGRCTALLFAKKGAKVCAISNGENGLKTLVSEIKQSGGSAVYAVADVAEFAQVKKAADYCVKEFGRIDTWVNNAGIYLYAAIDQATPEEYKRIMDVNFHGQVHGVLAALPHIRAGGGGALICVSSIASTMVIPYAAAYSATKHAVLGFIDGLRMEMQINNENIAVTNVRPASINTPLFGKSLSKLGVKPHGPAPVYKPSIVAETIVHCADHEERDVNCGTAGEFSEILKKLMPAAVDTALTTQLAINQTKTEEPRSENDENNFWGPLPHGKFDKEEGDFKDEQGGSILDWLRNKLSGTKA